MYFLRPPAFAQMKFVTFCRRVFVCSCVVFVTCDHRYHRDHSDHRDHRDDSVCYRDGRDGRDGKDVTDIMDDSF
jgi:hypothetical protein